MIDNGFATNLIIHGMTLVHNNVSVKNYQEEIAYLISSRSRNEYVSTLALSLNGNTLILYNYVDSHGSKIVDILNNCNSDHTIHFIHGDINSDDRMDICNKTELTSNNIIIASYGTFSTGISIKNLHNIIFAYPTKSRIRNIQSIGRGLRLHESKTLVHIYDIADLLNESVYNVTIEHYSIRQEYYKREVYEFENTEHILG